MSDRALPALRGGRRGIGTRLQTSASTFLGPRPRIADIATLIVAIWTVIKNTDCCHYLTPTCPS